MSKTGICKKCGKTFIKEKSGQGYCSDECRTIAHREQKRKYERKRQAAYMKQCQCAICSRFFTPKNVSQKTCSEECARIYKNRYPKNRKSTIDEINKQAQISGMSYGEYKAQLFLKNRGEIY